MPYLGLAHRPHPKPFPGSTFAVRRTSILGAASRGLTGTVLLGMEAVEIKVVVTVRKQRSLRFPGLCLILIPGMASAQ